MKREVLIPVCQRLRRLRTVNASLKGRKLNVGILGAGMAGLSAAWELSELGHEVTIYEGSPERVGGRIFTYRFGSDNPEHRVELGAMRIPPNHDYTHHYVNLMNLELRRFLNQSVCDQGRYDLRGNVGQVGDFGSKFIKPAKNGKPLFELHALERGLVLDENKGPGALIEFVLEQEVRKVRELGEVDKLLCGEMDTPNLRRLDSVSLGRRLSETLSVEGRFLTDIAAPVGGLADRSLAMHVRDSFTIKAQCLDEIKGGMDNLPKELARQLQERKGVRIEMDQEVIKLGRVTVRGRSKARVVFRKSSDRPQEFDLLICTIPFPVLKGMGRAVQGLSEPKMAAIHGMTYASSTKLGLECKQRFWEKDDDIFGGRSVTDHLTGQLYYPSATADLPPCGDLDGILAEREGITSLHTLSHRADCDCDLESLREKARRSNEPGVLLAYCWGGEARGFCRLVESLPDGPPNAAKAYRQVIDDVARLHPQIRQNTSPDDAVIMCWDSYKWTQGAFAALKPGELTAHYRSALQREGCIFFAGEHASPVPGWIQGAVASALFQVEQLLEYSAHREAAG